MTSAAPIREATAFFTGDRLASFHRDGFVIVRAPLAPEVIERVTGWVDALEAFPELAEAYLGIADARLLLRDRVGALAAIKQSVENAPEFATAYLDRVRIRVEDYEDLVHVIRGKNPGAVRPETE